MKENKIVVTQNMSKEDFNELLKVLREINFTLLDIKEILQKK
jgi:hypothetical protein|tara:strand:- start:426 stop:551 length:126 start_codon:yes stop_codon:yes gene_type:complete